MYLHNIMRMPSASLAATGAAKMMHAGDFAHRLIISITESFSPAYKASICNTTTTIIARHTYDNIGHAIECNHRSGLPDFHYFASSPLISKSYLITTSNAIIIMRGVTRFIEMRASTDAFIASKMPCQKQVLLPKRNYHHYFFASFDSYNNKERR